MNKIAAFVLSLFLCACNSSQKANMDNIISFEGINIETDITSFCDSLEKRGYEKIDVPNDAQSYTNFIIFYGNVANKEATINVYKDSLSQSVCHIKSAMKFEQKEEVLENVNSLIEYFKEKYPNAEYKTLNEDNKVEHYFFTSPILVCISSTELQNGEYMVLIDYDNTKLYNQKE